MNASRDNEMSDDDADTGIDDDRKKQDEKEEEQEEAINRGES